MSQYYKTGRTTTVVSRTVVTFGESNSYSAGYNSDVSAGCGSTQLSHHKSRAADLSVGGIYGINFDINTVGISTPEGYDNASAVVITFSAQGDPLWLNPDTGNVETLYGNFAGEYTTSIQKGDSSSWSSGHGHWHYFYGGYNISCTATITVTEVFEEIAIWYEGDQWNSPSLSYSMVRKGPPSFTVSGTWSGIGNLNNSVPQSGTFSFGEGNLTNRDFEDNPISWPSNSYMDLYYGAGFGTPGGCLICDVSSMYGGTQSATMQVSVTIDGVEHTPQATYAKWTNSQYSSSYVSVSGGTMTVVAYAPDNPNKNTNTGALNRPNIGSGFGRFGCSETRSNITVDVDLVTPNGSSVPAALAPTLSWAGTSVVGDSSATREFLGAWSVSNQYLYGQYPPLSKVSTARTDGGYNDYYGSLTNGAPTVQTDGAKFWVDDPVQDVRIDAGMLTGPIEPSGSVVVDPYYTTPKPAYTFNPLATDVLHSGPTLAGTGNASNQLWQDFYMDNDKEGFRRLRITLTCEDANAEVFLVYDVVNDGTGRYLYWPLDPNGTTDIDLLNPRFGMIPDQKDTVVYTSTSFPPWLSSSVLPFRGTVQSGKRLYVTNIQGLTRTVDIFPTWDNGRVFKVFGDGLYGPQVGYHGAVGADDWETVGNNAVAGDYYEDSHAIASYTLHVPEDGGASVGTIYFMAQYPTDLYSYANIYNKDTRSLYDLPPVITRLPGTVNLESLPCSVRGMLNAYDLYKNRSITVKYKLYFDRYIPYIITYRGGTAGGHTTDSDTVLRSISGVGVLAPVGDYAANNSHLDIYPTPTVSSTSSSGFAVMYFAPSPPPEPPIPPPPVPPPPVVSYPPPPITPPGPPDPPDPPEDPPVIPEPEIIKIVYLPDDTMYRRVVTALCFSGAGLDALIRASGDNHAPSTFRPETDRYIWRAEHVLNPYDEVNVRIDSVSIRRAKSEYDFMNSSDAVWMPAVFPEDQAGIITSNQRYVYMRNLEVVTATVANGGASTMIADTGEVMPDSSVWYEVPEAYREGVPPQLFWIKVDTQDVVFDSDGVKIKLPYGPEITEVRIRYRSSTSYETLVGSLADVNGFIVPLTLLAYRNQLDDIADIYSIKRNPGEDNVSFATRLRWHGIIKSIQGRMAPAFALANSFALAFLASWKVEGSAEVEELDLTEMFLGDATDAVVIGLEEEEHFNETLVPLERSITEQQQGISRFLIPSKSTVEPAYNVTVSGRHLIDTAGVTVSDGIVSFQFGATRTVTAAALKYTAKNYRVVRSSEGFITKLQSVPGNTPPGVYTVVFLRKIRLWEPAKLAAHYTEPTDDQKATIAELSEAARHVAQITCGNAMWGDAAVWFDDTQVTPALTHAPIKLDGQD